RAEDDELIVLQSFGPASGIGSGDVFPWKDSLDASMVAGLGPRIAPDVHDVAAYAAAPLAEQLAIGAYIGMPLVRESGAVFGTLSAFDPSPQPTAIEAELPTVELVARMLSTVLATELRVDEQRRRAERAELEMTVDPLTGLPNRRGWDRLMV